MQKEDGGTFRNQRCQAVEIYGRARSGEAAVRSAAFVGLNQTALARTVFFRFPYLRIPAPLLRFPVSDALLRIRRLRPHHASDSTAVPAVFLVKYRQYLNGASQLMFFFVTGLLSRASFTRAGTLLRPLGPLWKIYLPVYCLNIDVTLALLNLCGHHQNDSEAIINSDHAILCDH